LGVGSGLATNSKLAFISNYLNSGLHITQQQPYTCKYCTTFAVIFPFTATILTVHKMNPGFRPNYPRDGCLLRSLAVIYPLSVTVAYIHKAL